MGKKYKEKKEDAEARKMKRICTESTWQLGARPPFTSVKIKYMPI
jgi:hypothetical protein